LLVAVVAVGLVLQKLVALEPVVFVLEQRYLLLLELITLLL
jgi:hypothetical protein